MKLMRKLRREGFFENSMINEIEAESRIPDSFKKRNQRKHFKPVLDRQNLVKAEQVLCDEEKANRRIIFFSKKFRHHFLTL